MPPHHRAGGDTQHIARQKPGTTIFRRFFSGPDGTQVDQYEYGNVKFVADRAQSAFHEWHSEIEKRTVPAKLAEHLTEEDPCPCLSGKTFGTCCKGAETITVPHLQISFIGGTPNPSLPKNELHLKT